MARSKPQTKFYINYGPVTASADADALIPVFIAPRYALHGEDYGDGVLVSSTGAAIDYVGEAVPNLEWPNHELTAVIDTTTASVVFDNPTVEVGHKGGNAGVAVTAEIGSGSGFCNTLLFQSGSDKYPVAGGDTILEGAYQLRAGDTITLTSGGSAYSSGGQAVLFGVNAVSLDDGVVTPTVTVAGQPTSATEDNITANVSSFTGTETVAYALYVTSVGSDTLDARVVNTIGDTTYAPQLVTFTANADVAVGNFGLKVKFAAIDSNEVDTDTTVLVRVDPASGSEYIKVTLDRDIPDAYRTGATALIQTANLITGSVELESRFWSKTALELGLNANASVPFLGVNYRVVECANIFVDYRELLTEDANLIISGGNQTIEDWVGEMDPRNPIGMCYAAAVNSGAANFYLVAVEDDTDAAYAKALAAVGKIELAYALFPLRQTPAVISSARAIVAKYSDPSIAQMKRLWLYSQVKASEDVTGMDDALATVNTSGVLTLASGSFTGSGVKVGSKVTLKGIYNAATGNTYDAVTYIKEITSDITAKVSPVLNITSPVSVSFSNELNHSALAEAIAAKARSYGDHRINFVFAESNTVNDFGFDDAKYIVPVLCAMRSSMAPHAPLTDVRIPGVTIADGIGFTEDDYDTMNNAGVWICYRDSRGENVTRHAITTGGTGTIAEEDSAVSNGDNIVRYVRNSLQYLRGNCNVTPQLINQIDVDARAAFSSIQARVYSALIGPQILDVNSVSVAQDPNNTAGVIGKFDLDLPDVYLDGEFTFNLN